MRALAPLILLAGCASAADPGDRGATKVPSSPVVPPTVAAYDPGDTGRAAGGGPAPCVDDGFGWCEHAVDAGLGTHIGHGRGLLAVDVDNDGWDDVIDCESSFTVGGTARTKLFMNRGDGTFYTASAGLDPAITHECWGFDAGDYDRDGDLDLLMLNGGYFGDHPLHLLRNDLATTGRFTEVSAEAGLKPKRRNWWSGAFGDIDGDGCLDFVATARYGVPALYHSNCDGTFTEEAKARGVTVEFLAPTDSIVLNDDGKNPVWIDADLDGDLDLFVAGDVDLNAWYVNDGTGHFTDRTREAFPEPGIVWPAQRTDRDDAAIFSVSVADFDQDGWPDLYFGRYYDPDVVAFNQRDGTFRTLGGQIGLDEIPTTPGAYTPENTMGFTTGDLDLNGWPDAVVGPGTPAEGFDSVVFCNDGPTGEADAPMAFRRCSDAFVRGHGRQRVHGVVLADFDHDGRRDLLWNFGGFPFYDAQHLIRSDARNYLYSDAREVVPNTASVTLRGSRGDREAIGARVETVGTERHYQFVTTSQGFQSTSSRRLLLPLGQDEEVELRVRWLDGEETVTTIRAGQHLTIVQPGGTPPLVPRLPRPAEATFLDDAVQVWQPPISPGGGGGECGE